MAANSDEYYERKEDELKALKKADKQRGDTKDIQFVTNAETRRSTYSRRSSSLLITAREIEIQTHCSVNVEVLPTWKKGKVWRYASSLPQTPAQTSQPDTAAADVAIINHDDILSTPQKRHQPIRNESATLKKKKKNACNICNVEEETSFFLGCSYKPKKKSSKKEKETCDYWVHQGCIGLRYKKKETLAKVPFYCPKHL